MSEVRKKIIDCEPPNVERESGLMILMLLGNCFPPDIRVEKEARTLLKAGHKLFLLSLGKDEMQNDELVEGISVIRKKQPQSFLKKAWYYILFQTFFVHPFWKRALADTVKKYKIEVVHVHDLSLVKTAASVAKKFNVPIVIADLHENYPEGIRAWRKVKMPWWRRIINLFTPVWRWKRLERSVLQQVDKVITVVEEAEEHYTTDCGISPEKITVVMNTEDLEEFGNLEIKESLIANYKADFVISYIGGFGPHRGIDTAIKAMPKILEEIPDAKLLLVGKGSEEFDIEMNDLCKDLKVENKVEFTGWVPFDLVPTYIALSAVGLVPHHASGHTNTTIPHKLFQYMAMKKPVIVTDCKPLKRIVEECDCGLVVPSGDYKEMAEAVIKLYIDSELATKLGANGRNAVEVKYNWESEAKKLCELYKRLGGRR